MRRQRAKKSLQPARFPASCCAVAAIGQIPNPKTVAVGPQISLFFFSRRLTANLIADAVPRLSSQTYLEPVDRAGFRSVGGKRGTPGFPPHWPPARTKGEVVKPRASSARIPPISESFGVRARTPAFPGAVRLRRGGGASTPRPFLIPRCRDCVRRHTPGRIPVLPSCAVCPPGSSGSRGGAGRRPRPLRRHRRPPPWPSRGGISRRHAPSRHLRVFPVAMCSTRCTRGSEVPARYQGSCDGAG